MEVGMIGVGRMGAGMTRRLLRRGEALAAKGAHFLDCGTSGGIRGEREGFCLMVGGSDEGSEIMNASDYELDLHQIAELWRHGSVVRSWLLDLAAAAYRRDPELEALAGYVEDSGEGRWTVQEALGRNVPAPVINLSLLMRLRSRQRDSYGARVIAALRNEFGGHTIHPASTRTQQ